MSSATDPQYAAWIGLDWADEQHAVCLIVNGHAPQSSALDQTPEALDQWALSLRDRFQGRPCAVCLEQSRGALVFALMKYPFLVLYPINPKQLARYREAITPSGGKNDPTDAALLAEFAQKHLSSLRAWKPDDEQTRAIQLLSEARRQLVEQRTATGQRLRQKLKEFYPLALVLLGRTAIYAAWFLTLLRKFPTFRELKRASPKCRARYLGAGRSTLDISGVNEIENPLEQRVRQACPLVEDGAVIQAGRMEVQSLVPLLQQMQTSIDAYDDELGKLFEKHPDAPIFQSVPGAGAALAPRLVAAFGTDRTRFADAAAMQTFSGIAPVTKQSGKSCLVQRRYACPNFVRQTFQELAAHSIKFSPWAKAYYDMLRARGTRHHAAIRSLAYKWIRILFRCWQDRTVYDEQKYLQRLKQQNLPLLQYLPEISTTVA
jgi:transposase